MQQLVPGWIEISCLSDNITHKIPQIASVKADESQGELCGKTSVWKEGEDVQGIFERRTS